MQIRIEKNPLLFSVGVLSREMKGLEKESMIREDVFNTPKKAKLADRYITNSSGKKTVAYKLFSSSGGKRKYNVCCDSSKEETVNQIYKDAVANELLPYSSPILSPLSKMERPNSVMDYSNYTISQQSPLSKISASKLSLSTQKALQTPRQLARVISRTPYKVLDAPELQDDFYLNLVDWSSTNFLAVGLGCCVYLWNANTSKVIKLCDLSPYDSITSVNWIQRGSHIAIGTNTGFIQLWDVHRMKKVRQFSGHKARVGTLAWNEHLLSSGSRDRLIYQRDIRQSREFCMKLSGHRQEICGLKWNPEGSYLASGGNDNKLCIWDIRKSDPVLKYEQHVAAVKAIAWSPHVHGLLASGGGTADKCIKFWNTTTSSMLSSVDTGSQVCNLAWSKNSSELVSTHGYSQNQINIWKYPSMTQIANLTGHSFRVLYLAMSPDGQHIVTGAGDETLRFWTIFNKSKSDRHTDKTNLGLTIR